VRAKFGSQIYEATILEILGKYIKYWTV
jgi:hypothetical protein